MKWKSFKHANLNFIFSSTNLSFIYGHCLVPLSYINAGYDKYFCFSEIIILLKKHFLCCKFTIYSY